MLLNKTCRRAAAAPVAAPVTATLADLAVPATTTTAATAYSDPLQTGLAQYEALFCLPASFTPAAPVPANYTGAPPIQRCEEVAGRVFGICTRHRT